MKRFFLTLALPIVSALWMVAMPAHAVPAHITGQAQAAYDIDTSFTIATNNSALGATANLTATFTLTENMQRNDQIYFDIYNISYCEQWSNDCIVQINSATGVSGTLDVTLHTNPNDQVDNRAWVHANSDILAGTYTLTFNNVINPANVGGQKMIMTQYRGNTWETFSTANSVIYGTPSVTGTVTDKDGRPAEDVWVNAWPYNSNDSYRGYGSNTGPDGKFAIGGLISGIGYEVSAWLPEDLRDGNVVPANQRFNYSGSTQTVNIQLEAAVKKIRVTVTYADNGAAVDDANIWVYPTSGEGGAGENVDITGVAEFYVPKGKTYNMNVSPKWVDDAPATTDWIYNDRGLRPTITFADNDTPESQAVAVTVIRTNATVTGRILNVNGDPYARRGVDIRNREGIGNWTQTDANGNFSTPLPNGAYTINIWTGDGSVEYFTPVDITVAPNETLNVGTLQTELKTSTISGTVVDEDGTPVSGVPVNAWTTHRGPNTEGEVNGWGNDTTDSDGTFSIPVFAARWGIGIDQGRDNNQYIQTDTNFQAFEFDIAENASVADVVMHVKHSDITINVRVVDVNGDLVTGIWGHTEAVDANNPNSRTRYWAGLNAGTATIKAIAGPSAFQVLVFFPPESDFSLQEPVTIDNPQSGETYNVTLTAVDNNASIHGVLKDDEGVTIKGIDANVYVMDIDYPNWRNARVDSETGGYEISLLGGRQYMVNYELFNTSEYLNDHGGEATVLAVANGQDYLHDINITRSSASIVLTVLDPDGNPIPRPWLWCDNGPSLEARGDFKGGRHINVGQEGDQNGQGTLAVTAGTWNCSAGLDPVRMGNYLPPDFRDITIAEGKTVSETLQFKKSDGQLTGTITYADSGASVAYGGVYAWSPDGPHSWTPIENGRFTLPLSAGTWFVGADTVQGTKFYRGQETQIQFSGSGTLNFSLVSETFDVPKSESFSFDAGVAQRLVFEDGTQLVIPQEALGSSGETVTVTGSPTADLRHMAGKIPPMYGYDFDAVNANNESISQFNSPVTIRIPYLQEVIDEKGIEEGDLVFDYWDDDSNAYKSTNGVQNEDENFFEASVTHFTVFTVNSSSGGAEAKAAITGSAKNIVVSPLSKGGPQVTIWNKDGKLLSTFFAYNSKLRMGVETEVGDLSGDGKDDIITYPAHSGVTAQVRIFDGSARVLGQFFPYGANYKGRIHVRIADLDGDGNVEIVTYPHASNDPLKIFDKAGKILTPGLSVGLGGGWLELDDVDNNGTTEMIVAGTKPDGRVKVFNKDKTLRNEFNAFGGDVNKGVESLRVADLDKNGRSEIIVSTGTGGNLVRVFTDNGLMRQSFHPFAESFQGGARIAVGDIDSDDDLEIVAFPNDKGSAHARVFDGNGNLMNSFFAYSQNTTRKGKFFAELLDVDGNGKDEIVVGAGEGLGPLIRTFNGSGKVLSQFMALRSGFRGGVIINGSER